MLRRPIETTPVIDSYLGCRTNWLVPDATGRMICNNEENVNG